MQNNLANLTVHHESLQNPYYGSKEEYICLATRKQRIDKYHNFGDEIFFLLQIS